MVTLEQVNEWARKSCPKWNKSKLGRRYYRAKYRDVAREYWESPEHQALIFKNRSELCAHNTYPWPYRAPGFADWEEDGSDGGYNLISDQSGCVIKYATSYCAWKIFEATGTWPQKTSNERLDAKHWVQFLAEASYTEAFQVPAGADCSTPEVQELLDVKFGFVGVNPDEGKWGSVVWLEGVDPNNSPPGVFVSSYVDRKYHSWWDSSANYTWVKITK